MEASFSLLSFPSAGRTLALGLKDTWLSSLPGYRWGMGGNETFSNLPRSPIF